MGKGLIQVPPKTVFEAISNPRTRCIYDEMLKVRTKNRHLQNRCCTDTILLWNFVAWNPLC